jgi:hypothetical protein
MVARLTNPLEKKRRRIFFAKEQSGCKNVLLFSGNEFAVPLSL